MTRKAEPAGSGRVSPTAPAEQSASHNIWKLLSRTPGIREAILRGRQQIADGDSVTTSELREEFGRGR